MVVDERTLRLDVKDLQVQLDGSSGSVVDQISFSVRAGEIFGLVGESGSGKTTLALALLGYTRRGLRISRGSILLDGKDILRLDPTGLREARGSKIAYVPQDPSSALNPALRIGHQIHELLKAHPTATDDAEHRIGEVLREVNLDPDSGVLRRFPHQLSGGQQQRIALAMAFACRSSVIVLDEPTTGLDVSTQRHVLDTVKTLCAAYGVAAIYVSHDLAVVGGLVSQVGVMYAGRLVEAGPIDRVFASPIHPYSQGLLGAIPSPDRAEDLWGIPGQPPRPGSRPNGCSFAARCPEANSTCLEEDPPSVEIEGRQVRCIRVKDRESFTVRVRSATQQNVSSSEQTLLQVRSLATAYGQTKVLHGVDLNVPTESTTAIVGESGSGKTTLARCVVGLHDGFDGSIIFDGNELNGSARRRSPEQLRRIQYVFQNPYTSLNPRKTIAQILSQPLEHFMRLNTADRSERISRVLDEVSLGNAVGRRFPDELSGGERQRVAIARAIIVEPRLLVCDEVTSALDVSVQAVIVELLRRLQRERQLSMLFITHNLALVRSIAQNVVVVSHGRVVETGPVEDVIERPKDPYTIRLMQDIPKLDTASSVLPPT